MSEISSLLLTVMAGMLLGSIFFGGLWWTVRSGIAAYRPALWFMCSMLLRICFVMAGFYFLLDLSGNSWKTLLAGLLGFIAARLAAIRLLPAPFHKTYPGVEPSVKEEPDPSQRGYGVQREQRVQKTQSVGHAP